MEVNCGGKGVWFRAKVIQVHAEMGEYQVKYENDSIKWVGDSAVEGTAGEKNRCMLSTARSKSGRAPQLFTKKRTI